MYVRKGRLSGPTARLDEKAVGHVEREEQEDQHQPRSDRQHDVLELEMRLWSVRGIVSFRHAS